MSRFFSVRPTQPAADQLPLRRWYLLALILVLQGTAARVVLGLGPITMVEASSTWNSDDEKTAVATCPSGMIAFSAGTYITSPSDQVAVTWSQSINDPPNEWMVSAKEVVPTSVSWSVTVQAQCADIPGFEKVTASSDVNSDNVKQLPVYCPQGKTVIGAGSSIASAGSDQVHFRQSIPVGNGWFVTASEHIPTASGWHLGVMVSCAPTSDLDLEIISASAYIQSVSFQRLGVSCAANRMAIAGGWAPDDEDTNPYGLYGSSTSLWHQTWDVHLTSLQGEQPFGLDVYALCLSREIFVDGFESGSTDQWSATVP